VKGLGGKNTPLPTSKIFFCEKRIKKEYVKRKGKLTYFEVPDVLRVPKSAPFEAGERRVESDLFVKKANALRGREKSDQLFHRKKNDFPRKVN